MAGSALPPAVIFDNDGLLLATESVWTLGEEELFTRRGMSFTAEHKLELVGTNAGLAGEILARHLGEQGNERQLIDELDEIVFAALDRGVEPMPGALELIASLRERELPIAIVSNSPMRFILKALELVGIERAFGAIVSGHEVPAPKPAPDAYLAACRELGVEAGREVIVLEDSPTGVAAGVAAGLTVLGIPSVDGVELDQAHDIHSSLADPRLLARLGL